MTKDNVVLVMCVIAFDAIASSHSQSSFLVNTRNGAVRGQIKSIEAQNYGLFQGIPFAEPPVGPLRFEAPVPKRSWGSDVLDASKTIACIQPDKDNASMSEDCLYLSVITPKINDDDNTQYPVMFWIHGGSLLTGSAVEYVYLELLRANIVKRGIVLVATNYRLGALGFYTTRSSTVPGNNGFLDQIMALKWTRDNVAAFGGNPDEVTAFGESSGATSVSMLSISPLATGLFSRMILESGSSLEPGGFLFKVSGDFPSKFEQNLGCYRYPDERALVDCLRRKSVTEISAAEPQTSMGNEFWAAALDGIFLPDTIENLMKHKRAIPAIVGSNKDEMGGMFETDTFTADELRSRIRSNKYFIRSQGFTKPAALPGLQAAAIFTYVDSVRSPNPDPDALESRSFWLNQTVQLSSGSSMFGPTYREASFCADSGAPVYLFSFDHLSDEAMWDLPIAQTWRGVVHTAELMYLFAPAYPLSVFTGPITSQIDRSVADLMGELWTNFAKYGNPTPSAVRGVVWEQLDLDKTNYLSITLPDLRMLDGYHTKDVAFWNGLVPALNQRDSVCNNDKYKYLGGMPLFIYSAIYC